GIPPELDEWFGAGGQGAELFLDTRSITGTAALRMATVHTPDALALPDYGLQAAQQRGGYRAGLAVPLVRDGRLVGVLTLLRNHPVAYTEDRIDLVTTFADQAVIAIENARLLHEIESRNRELTEALEQQTATS